MYYPDPASDVTVAPYRRTVGHEVEYSSGNQLAADLQSAGLGTPGGRYGGLHSGGCRCPDGNEYPVHTTSDGTAPGGEYIIGGNRGVLFGSPAYIQATKILSDAAIKVGCGVTERVGMHTHVGLHVSALGRSRARVQRNLSLKLGTGKKINILRIYLRFQDDIKRLAAGPLNEVRHNGCMYPNLDLRQILGWNNLTERDFWTMDESSRTRFQFPSRPTLNFGGETVEFRIWNSTLAQWRMVMAGAVSTAIVEAAAQGRKATQDTEGTLVGFLEGLLTPDILMLIERQEKKLNA